MANNLVEGIMDEFSCGGVPTMTEEELNKYLLGRSEQLANSADRTQAINTAGLTTGGNGNRKKNGRS